MTDEEKKTVDTHATEEEQEVEELNPQPTQVEEEIAQLVQSAQPSLKNEGKTFTQDELNKYIGNTRTETREKTLRGLYDTYGVNDEKEMNDIFGKGQKYDMLNEDYERQTGEYQALKEENALLKSNVLPEKWKDVTLILKGQGMEVSLENIEKEKGTHPEWFGSEVSAQQQNIVQQEPKLKVLGNEHEKPKEVTSDDVLTKYFGL